MGYVSSLENERFVRQCVEIRHPEIGRIADDKIGANLIRKKYKKIRLAARPLLPLQARAPSVTAAEPNAVVRRNQRREIFRTHSSTVRTESSQDGPSLKLTRAKC
jgi:hypothetical protein